MFRKQHKLSTKKSIWGRGNFRENSKQEVTLAGRNVKDAANFGTFETHPTYTVSVCLIWKLQKEEKDQR